ncbi:hypothetical protein B0A52_00911 [Exophiala mesophila]|uniref:Phosphoglycerate mutase n=1 Tax=Exophiala mesophila TaxID=212818 RepID=A0A438NIK9_EXOME|nr:hypothetical protein B0A52_00911 [Exophiala mesophila]
MSDQKVLDIHTEPDPGAGVDGEIIQEQTAKRYKYTTVKGYFLQDDPSTDPNGFDFTATNFGLIDRAYDSDRSLPNNGRDLTAWQRFEHQISELNKAARARHESTSQISYKLLFLGRHGNGFHNVAERYYGPEAWDCHFSTLDGDDEHIMTWSDAHLTKEGIRQAKEANQFWKKQLNEQKISLPQSYYVSPLDRAMETANVTFEDLVTTGDGFRPVVLERLREGSGIHTCDRRSGVSYIKGRFPNFITDKDPLLTEKDTYWDPIYRETNDALAARQAKMLDSVVSVDDNERISLTAHSGAISMLLKVVGHRRFALGTGAVIPVLIKIETLDEAVTRRHGDEHEPVTHVGNGWQTKPDCPAGLDLDNIGKKRWNMGLKEFLRRVEDGTLQIEEVAFTGRH